MAGLEGIDDVNSLWEYLSRPPSKQGEHADVAGIHAGDRSEDHDDQYERGRRDPEQSQYGAGIGINHVAAWLIKYRHRIPSPAIVCQWRCGRGRPARDG